MVHRSAALARIAIHRNNVQCHNLRIPGTEQAQWNLLAAGGPGCRPNEVRGKFHRSYFVLIPYICWPLLTHPSPVSPIDSTMVGLLRELREAFFRSAGHAAIELLLGHSLAHYDLCAARFARSHFSCGPLRYWPFPATVFNFDKYHGDQNGYDYYAQGGKPTLPHRWRYPRHRIARR
jgi:hypothetical protein